MRNDSNKPAPNSGHFHAVRFYENADALTRLVAEFLGEGLTHAQPAVAIATPSHATLIEAHLSARGFDVVRLKTSGTLMMLDAGTTLSLFMRDGMPDAELFRRAITPVIETAGRTRKDAVVRAYGEMVDVLWKAGQTVAAIKLEMLWNQLAQTHQFSLLCGYAMGSFYKDLSIEDICGQHTHVLSPEGAVGTVQ